VLLGIPILLTAYGPDATLPVLLLIAFHGPTLMPLTMALIQVGQGREVSAGRQFKMVGVELVKNPIIMGLLLGLAANVGGLTLPAGIDRTVEMLGSSAIPCALFAMGASLAGYPLAGDVPPAVLLGVVKAMVHPLLVWVLAVPVFGLEGIWVPVAVTMAAMPTGVNAYLFGARYEAAPGVAARTVLLSTVVSVGTISLVLLLFQPGEFGRPGRAGGNPAIDDVPDSTNAQHLRAAPDHQIPWSAGPAPTLRRPRLGQAFVPLIVATPTPDGRLSGRPVRDTGPASRATRGSRGWPRTTARSGWRR
jgi:hypothetical protein